MELVVCVFIGILEGHATEGVQHEWPCNSNRTFHTTQSLSQQLPPMTRQDMARLHRDPRRVKH